MIRFGRFFVLYRKLPCGICKTPGSPINFAINAKRSEIDGITVKSKAKKSPMLQEHRAFLEKLRK